jgi:predicted pyridoxine 5'-phosphate oxidase superfamily flavin-nucleotide-binding protein
VGAGAFGTVRAQPDRQDRIRSEQSHTPDKNPWLKAQRNARADIERSQFVCFGTSSKSGTADVSPRGDPCGFAKIVDKLTHLIPGHPANNRLDRLTNILSNSRFGLLFMVPGIDGAMRVNGDATLTRDPDLLWLMSVNNRIRTVAIAVHVEEVFIHCAKALR